MHKKPSRKGRVDRLADILFIFPNIVLIVQHAIRKHHKFVALVEVVKENSSIFRLYVGEVVVCDVFLHVLKRVIPSEILTNVLPV